MTKTIGSLLTAAGYSPIDEDACRSLDAALGDQWRKWLEDCVRKGQQSQHWEALRSALFAVSPTTNAMFAALSIWKPVTDRVLVMVEQGRALRAAVVTLTRNTSEPEQKQAAVAFIKAAFDSAKRGTSTTTTEIESKVHRVYGTKSAVTFEASSTKSNRACLQIEAAQRGPSGDVDWARKIILQLSEDESLQMLAILRGWSQSMEVSNHGESRDKRMTFSRQSDQPGFLVSVRQGSNARVVPIAAFAAYRIIALVVRVLVENSPHLTPDLIFEMAKELASHAPQAI